MTAILKISAIILIWVIIAAVCCYIYFLFNPMTINQNINLSGNGRRGEIQLNY